jgi:hypothetical protein
MNEYQKTEWVFDHGNCEGCHHLMADPGDHHNPASNSCGVLDNWRQHSDRCPRREQFDEAFAAQLKALKPSEVIEDNWQSFVTICTAIVDGSFWEDDVKAGEAIRSLYAEVAQEEAERRMS